MKTENKPFINSSLIYFVIIILAVIQVVISNRLASFGKKISNLSIQTKQLTLENERIKKKIASSSALISLTQKAGELGFNQKISVEYLDELYSVAQNSF